MNEQIFKVFEVALVDFNVFNAKQIPFAITRIHKAAIVGIPTLLQTEFGDVTNSAQKLKELYKHHNLASFKVLVQVFDCHFA